MDLPDKLFFRIGEVAELVGVETHVLRYWESEFRLRPHRSGSGQRMYRKQDVAKLLRVRQLLHEEGYTIAGARKALHEADSPAPASDSSQLREALRRVRLLRTALAELRAELNP